MNILAQKYIDRFWGKVNKEKSTIFYNGTRCWEWTAGCDSNGYGNVCMGTGSNRNYAAHRVSYELIVEEIPSNLLVLHHCDNRRCVNPEHLFLGTNQDNMDDRNRKGRQASGERMGVCKLLDSQVAEIRRRYRRYVRGGGEGSVKFLAKEF